MSKYVITGSIGHISREIVKGLTQAGKEVTVITSSPERVSEIEKLGARALVGSVNEADFVNQAFQGADVVYTMIPPIWQTNDWRKSQQVVARNYAESIRLNKVKFVVNLSSIGAHLEKGNGPIGGVHDLEQLLNKIEGLNVLHLRPSYFYYNFLSQISLAENAGILGGNFGEGEKLFLVHTNDIAEVGLKALLDLSFTGSSYQYILGDERSGQEIAEVLGNAIGKPLNWVVFSDEQQKQGLLQAGLPETHAQAFTEMGTAIRTGVLQADARKTNPAFSRIKLEDFAKEFAEAYQAAHVNA